MSLKHPWTQQEKDKGFVVLELGRTRSPRAPDAGACCL